MLLVEWQAPSLATCPGCSSVLNSEIIHDDDQHTTVRYADSRTATPSKLQREEEEESPT